MFKTILTPTDGSPLSERAVHAAIEFAQASGARVIGMSVALPDLTSPLEAGTSEQAANLYKQRLSKERAHW